MKIIFEENSILKALNETFKSFHHIDEGKWNFDTVGPQGSISKYIDGVQSVSFILDTKRQRWTYIAKISSSDKAPGYAQKTIKGDVPKKYEFAFDNGTIQIMTKVAKDIINNEGKITEADEAKPSEEDEKLKTILEDLYDHGKLLYNKFQELKDAEEDIRTSSDMSKQGEYGNIQKDTFNDNLMSIKHNIINLGRLFQFFTQYITKYGYQDINKKKQTQENKINELEGSDYSTTAGYIADLMRKGLKSDSDIKVEPGTNPGNEHILKFVINDIDINGKKIKIPVMIDLHKIIKQ